MKSEDPRDPIDELLRQSLRETARTAPAQACLDADTMAAWIDGALSRDELSRAEAHAAECDRCQAILSSIVRTTPAAPGRRWWPAISSARWLVPIAAAAVMIIWIVAPMRTARVTQSAALRPGAEAPQLSPPVAPELKGAPDVAPDLQVRRNALRGTADVVAGPTSVAPRASAALTAQPPAGQAHPPSEMAKMSDSANAAAPESRERAERPAAFEAAPSRPSSPPPAASPAVVDSVSPTARSPLAVIGAARAGAPPARVTLEVRSPDPSVRWRAGDGVVQRSVNGGATWTTHQTVTDSFAAGSSPSRDVCWIVGPAGVVLVSADGVTWQARRVPDAADLVAIRATDARTAIVTTADGRQFSTADGGVTWSRVQEPPPASF